MALIVGGTTVTGTQTLDATKLTGNLPAISGASLTGISVSSIPVVTTGVVGSFANLRLSAATSVGGTNALSSAGRWSNSERENGGNSGLSGTWRLHGYSTSSSVTGLWQRIS